MLGVLCSGSKNISWMIATLIVKKYICLSGQHWRFLRSTIYVIHETGIFGLWVSDLSQCQYAMDVDRRRLNSPIYHEDNIQTATCHVTRHKLGLIAAVRVFRMSERIINSRPRAVESAWLRTMACVISEFEMIPTVTTRPRSCVRAPRIAGRVSRSGTPLRI